MKKKKERIAFVLDQELKEKINKRAMEEGLSGMSAYIKWLIMQDLKKIDKEK